MKKQIFTGILLLLLPLMAGAEEGQLISSFTQRANDDARWTALVLWLRKEERLNTTGELPAIQFAGLACEFASREKLYSKPTDAPTGRRCQRFIQAFLFELKMLPEAGWSLPDLRNYLREVGAYVPVAASFAEADKQLAAKVVEEASVEADSTAEAKQKPQFKKPATVADVALEESRRARETANFTSGRVDEFQRQMLRRKKHIDQKLAALEKKSKASSLTPAEVSEFRALATELNELRARIEDAATVSYVDQKINGVSDVTSVMSENFDRLSQEHAEMKVAIEHVQETLTGADGQSGLVKRVAEIEGHLIDPLSGEWYDVSQMTVVSGTADSAGDVEGQRSGWSVAFWGVCSVLIFALVMIWGIVSSKSRKKVTSKEDLDISRSEEDEDPLSGVIGKRRVVPQEEVDKHQEVAQQLDKQSEAGDGDDFGSLPEDVVGRYVEGDEEDELPLVTQSEPESSPDNDVTVHPDIVDLVDETSADETEMPGSIPTDLTFDESVLTDESLRGLEHRDCLTVPLYRSDTKDHRVWKLSVCRDAGEAFGIKGVKLSEENPTPITVRTREAQTIIQAIKDAIREGRISARETSSEEILDITQEVVGE